MEYFTVRDGKVRKSSKEELEKQNGTPYAEIVKDMTPEERKRFEKERYEKFLKPLMEHNTRQVRNLKDEKEE